MESFGYFYLSLCGNRGRVSHSSWLLIYQGTLFFAHPKRLSEILMIRIYIWVFLLLAIAFIKYEWFKQFFIEPSMSAY